jgi:ABC-type spermidine/putrescine transport system permease subunit II
MQYQSSTVRTEPRMLRAYTVFLTAFLVVPIVVVLIASLSDSELLVFPPPALSFRWYRDLFQDRRLLESLRNSAIIAVGASGFCTITGTLAGMGLTHVKPAVRKTVLWLLSTIAAMPVLLLALPTLMLLSLSHIPRGKSAIIGLLTAVLLPIPVFITVTRIASLDPLLREAGTLLGAKWWQIELFVIAPLLIRQTLASFLLLLVFGFDDLIVSYFLGGSVETFPTAIYSMVRFGLSPVAMAACALVYTCTIAGIIVLAVVWQSRFNP